MSGGATGLVRLDILSDPICPWCYIGKANLDRALEQAPDHPFAVEWHPFMLNPDLPAGGVDRDSYLTEKLGGRAAMQRAQEAVRARALEAGLDLDPEAAKRIPNTLDAHRLIHWAGLEGRQTATVSALFAAHWRQGRDIGDAATLADIAGEVGLDRGMIARLLASDADRAEIAARDAHSRRMGVQAVPTFIVGQRHAVQGARPPELWARVIAELRPAP